MHVEILIDFEEQFSSAITYDQASLFFFLGAGGNAYLPAAKNKGTADRMLAQLEIKDTINDCL